jgi:hypothetical protein
MKTVICHHTCTAVEFTGASTDMIVGCEFSETEDFSKCKLIIWMNIIRTLLVAEAAQPAWQCTDAGLRQPPSPPPGVVPGTRLP